MCNALKEECLTQTRPHTRMLGPLASCWVGGLVGFFGVGLDLAKFFLQSGVVLRAKIDKQAILITNNFVGNRARWLAIEHKTQSAILTIDMRCFAIVEHGIIERPPKICKEFRPRNGGGVHMHQMVVFIMHMRAT